MGGVTMHWVLWLMVCMAGWGMLGVGWQAVRWLALLVGRCRGHDGQTIRNRVRRVVRRWRRRRRSVARAAGGWMRRWVGLVSRVCGRMSFGMALSGCGWDVGAWR